MVREDIKATINFSSQEVLEDYYESSFQERWRGSQTGINQKLSVRDVKTSTVDLFFRKFGSQVKDRNRREAGGRQVKEGLLVCIFSGWDIHKHLRLNLLQQNLNYDQEKTKVWIYYNIYGHLSYNGIHTESHMDLFRSPKWRKHSKVLIKITTW